MKFAGLLALTLFAALPARADMTIEQFRSLEAKALTDQSAARSLRDYTAGLSEGIGWAAIAAAHQSGQAFYCPPKGELFSADEWRALIGKEIADHSELYKGTGAYVGLVATAALIRQYPCRK